MENNEKLFPIENRWIGLALLGHMLVVLLCLPVLVLIVQKENFSVGTFAQPWPWLLVLFYAAGYAGYLFLLRANFTYSFDADKITLMQGVVQKAERTIFYQRIQNVVLSRGLIARQFDVAGISFETAAQLGARKSEREESATLWKIMGFDHTQVTIPGLKIANAISLKKLLLERIEQVSGKNDNSGL